MTAKKKPAPKPSAKDEPAVVPKTNFTKFVESPLGRMQDAVCEVDGSAVKRGEACATCGTKRE